MDDDDSNSWVDRCERYFSSIADSDEKSKGTKNTGSKEKDWKNLSDVGHEISKSKTFFSRIKSLISVVDIHGLRLAAYAEGGSITFYFWTLLSLLFCGAFGFTVYLSMQSYLNLSSEYRMSNVRDYSDKKTNTHNLAVTICNMNLLKKSSISGTRFENLLNLTADHSNNQQVTKSAEHLLRQSNVLKLLQDGYSEDEVRTLLRILDEGFVPYLWMLSDDDWSGAFRGSVMYNTDTIRDVVMPTREELRNYGHQRRQLMMDCSTNGIPCKNSDIYDHQEQNLGNCVKINPRDILLSGNLQIIVNVEPDEYIDGLNPSVGVVIMLHDNSTYGRSGAVYTLSPGYSANMNIHKVTSIFDEDGRCNDDMDYNIDNCVSECEDSYIKEYCNCRYHVDAPWTDQCKLNEKQTNICVRTVRKLVRDDKLSCGCARNCRMSHFDLDFSTVSWPSSGYTKYLDLALRQKGLDINATYIRKSLARISIHTDHASYVEMKKSSKSIIQLLSDIGGLSALLCGISVLSVMELLWVIVRICCHGCKKAVHRRQNVKSVHRLAESEITSVTWTAYKEKRRQEVLEQNSTPFNSHALRRSFNSQFLLPIKEEAVSEELKSTPLKTEDKLYARPWERTGHHRLYNNVLNSKQEKGAEFPVFNSLEEMETPKSTNFDHDVRNSNDRFRNGIHSSNGHNGCSHYYPQRNRTSTPTNTFTPGDAVQMYGNSAAKYYCSEPLFL